MHYQVMENFKQILIKDRENAKTPVNSKLFKGVNLVKERARRDGYVEALNNVINFIEKENK